MHKILILNLGDTSTKVSIFEDEQLFLETTLRHSDEEMQAAQTQGLQLAFRTDCIQKWLDEQQLSAAQLDAAVIRTVAAKRCTKSGTYQVNEALRNDIVGLFEPEEICDHAAYLTLMVLENVLGKNNIPIYLVDAVYVDEFEEVARISGYPALPRESTFHALNQKAVARDVAAQLGKQYDECKLVIAHMGGGTSVGAHDCGRVVDCSNAGYGNNGPFSPTRTGELPTVPLVKLCYSGKYTEKEMINQLVKKGGFYAYTGLTDIRLVEANAQQGDEKAALIMKAYIYQMSKEIAAQSSVLNCRPDAIVLTGGMANSKMIVEGITNRVGAIAQVLIYPGEKEAEAMVAGALRVLRGEEDAIQL